MAISDWPENERPREKLLQRGPESLSDAELLAIFLRTGSPGKSAVDMARDLMQEFKSLNTLFAANEQDFCKTKGLGRAKYVQLQAVMEMARRSLKEQLKARDTFSSPETVRSYLRLTLSNLAQEVFMVIFLDAQNRIIAAENLFTGTLTQTSVYPREVVKRALHHNAAGIIFAHNHPSGVAEPSASDRTLTQALKSALTLVDIKVLDHFIIGSNSITSFAERGII